MGDRPIRGSCLCGGVRFEITGPPLWMTQCHCGRCRKAGGLTNLVVRAEHFRWVQGRELVARYQPPAPWSITRSFCRVCGSYLGEPEAGPVAYTIAASALDDDPGVRIALHEHVADKAPWYEILDDRPRFPGAPPIGGSAPE
jgi:hypothetical protein